MKQKILKLIKILNKFTIDDILSMNDFEEQEVSEILSELENSGIINNVEEMMSKHTVIKNPSIDEIFEIDKEVRLKTREKLNSVIV